MLWTDYSCCTFQFEAKPLLVATEEDQQKESYSKTQALILLAYLNTAIWS